MPSLPPRCRVNLARVTRLALKGSRFLLMWEHDHHEHAGNSQDSATSRATGRVPVWRALAGEPAANQTRERIRHGCLPWTRPGDARLVPPRLRRAEGTRF